MKRKIASGRMMKVLKNVGMQEVKSPGGIILGRAPAFEVNQAAMDRALQNVMRGIYFSLNETPLAQDCEFRIRMEQGDNLRVFQREIDAMVPWQSFGDDVFACRYLFDVNVPGSMNCLLAFYRQRVFYGWACPRTLLEAADKWAAERISALAGAAL
jgi:hypothetical protein